MHTLLLRGLVASMLAICAGTTNAQTIIYVNAGLATGANDGTSWANAYQDRLGLRHALDALPPGVNAEIWIVGGTYAPAPSNGDRMLSFAMRNNMKLLGGFAGNETAASQRNPVAHVTVLTGDLNQNDSSSTIPSTPDNAHHVVRADQCDQSAVLDGVVIRHGDATQHGLADVIDREAGGGIYITGGSPSISNCTIKFCNASWFGGGLAISAASPTITGCTIASNRCQAFGSGVAICSGSTALIQGCTIQSNSGALGTGLYNGPIPGQPDGNNRPTIRDTRFLNNLGNISVGQGTGMCDDGGSPVIERCEFRGNVGSSDGGGLLLHNSTAIVRNCDFSANIAQADPGDAINAQGGSPSVEGCVFHDHHPTLPFFPFGLTIVANNGAALTLSNCTITGNGGTSDTAAVAAFNSASISVRNCIIWNNTNASGKGVDAALRAVFGGSLTVDRSCVQGWNNQYPGTGNFQADPLFAGPPATDFRLSPQSPCIDAGNNSFAPAGLVVDANNRPRRYGAPKADTGAGTAPVIDIGAYEFICPADIDGDNTVDLVDFFAFFNGFDQSTPAADIDGSGGVDLADFFAFFNAFDAGC